MHRGGPTSLGPPARWRGPHLSNIGIYRCGSKLPGRPDATCTLRLLCWFGRHLSLFSVWVGSAASISLSDGVGTHSLPSFLRGRAPLPPLSSVESGPAHCGSSIGSARPRFALWRRSSVAPSANTLPPRGVCAERVPQQRLRGESPASSLSFFSSVHLVLHVHDLRRLHAFGCVTLQ